MLVSTNTQLNILVANSTNKVLKEVLKEADVKTLITSQNKDLNVSTLLKSLFSNIQNNSKSNETILNLLKNSNLNKDLGSFTSNLQSLVKALPDDKSTEQLKTFLQKFSITPEQTTSKEVKEQIQKSGIFLESKLLNQATNPSSKNENSLLNDMKAVLLKTKVQIEAQINTQSKTQVQNQNKVETTPQNSNQAITQNVNKENINIPQTLKQIDNLLTQIKNLETSNIKEQVAKPNINNESKPIQQANQPTAQSIKSDSALLNDIKDILTKVQAQLQGQVSNQGVSKENSNIPQTLKQIDNLLTQLKNLETSNIKEQVAKPNINNELKPIKQVSQQANQPANPTNDQSIKSDSVLLNDIKDILTKFQAQLQGQVSTQSKVENTSQNSNQVITQSANKENINIPQTLKQIDNLLTQIKNLETSNIKEQVTKPNINNESKPTQQVSQPTNPTTVQSIKSDSILLNDIKDILTKVQAQLQGQVSNEKTQSTVDNPSKQIETSPQGKESQIKSTLQSTSQLLQMKVQLKEEVQPQNQSLNKENINVKDTLKQIDKILTDIKNIDLQNPKDAAVKITTSLDAKTALPSNTFSIRTDSPIFNDIKTVLSKVQEQLQNQIQNQAKDIDDIKSHISKDANPKEIFKHVDKLLTQIDYHQLYSIANSSNNVYIPFLWDLLEDGSIDIKKADDEKFYCLIDLTLKDLGKINLHLYLYEDDKLDISVFVEKEDTKQLIRQKATSLRRELNGTGISVIGLNIHTLKEDTKQNFYKQNDDFDFGVNIKV
ncbi:flagellar hook-length control protein FliK [Arcobacter sp.]|uniref:flagellar hook-length control protein FliK n=1 Tax=unclassified Arcobacter TaxID=2593671 RepID=UPI003AFFC2C2